MRYRVHIQGTESTKREARRNRDKLEERIEEKKEKG